MKENQNAAFFYSKSFGRDTDALTSESKETNELNDSRIDASPVALEAKDRDESSKCKVMDEFSMDNENENLDSPRKEGQNGLSHHLSGWDKDADSLSSDSNDTDKERRSPDHEISATVEEFADFNRSYSTDPRSQCNGASDFETDTNLFTDKNVLECEVPELKVCYKDIDCQTLKDICVDEGRPEKDINVIESCKDEKPGHLFPQPPKYIDHFEVTEDSSLEYADDLSADQCGSKEEDDGKKLVSQGTLEYSLDNSFEDTAKHCDPEDPVQTGQGNCGATGRAETNSSEEHPLVDRELPIKDFGAGNKVTQPPDQILNEKAVSESPATLSAEAGGTGEDVQASNLLYNRKVESGTITFNFNSPVPEVVDNGETKNVEGQSADSGDVHSDVKAESPSDSVEVQGTGSVENVQEESLVIKDGNSDGGSATSYAPCVKSDDNSGENAIEKSPEHKDSNSDDLSTDGPVEFPGNGSRSSTSDAQGVEPNVLKHERRNSGNVSVVSQLQHDEGEMSFSAASLINYSGAIAYSGSLSHRSDGSTTSGKSFAFPVLQSEWNSSPVRMAKADSRHFRKHKGWRSGLLCCRF